MRFEEQFGGPGYGQVICNEKGEPKPYQDVYVRRGRTIFKQVVNQGDFIIAWRGDMENGGKLTIRRGGKLKKLETNVMPVQIADKVVQYSEDLFKAGVVLQKMVFNPDKTEIRYFIDREQGDDGFLPFLAKPKRGAVKFLSPKMFKPVKDIWYAKHIGKLFTRNMSWIPNGKPIPEFILEAINNKYLIKSDNPGLAQVYQVGQGFVVVIEDFPDERERKVKKDKTPVMESNKTPITEGGK